MNVILDWGFWTQDERDAIKLFYVSREIPVEMHYIEVSDERWKRNIKKRNEAILRGDEKAYYCDDQLRELLGSKFEIPSSSEIDKWIK